MAPPFSIEELRNKLPVWRTVKQTFRISFKYAWEFFRLAWVWLVFFIVPIVAGYTWYLYEPMKQIYSRPFGSPEPIPAELLSQLAVAGLIVNLLMAIPGASIAVTWHRFLLRREARPAGIMRFDGVVIRYLFAAFAMAILMQAPSLLAMSLQGTLSSDLQMGVTLVAGHVGLAIAILLGRLIVILPAISVENGAVSVSDAFRVTRGNTLRIALATVLVYAPFILPASLVPLLAIRNIESELGAAAVLGTAFLFAQLCIFMLLTLLSILYWHFYERRFEAGGEVSPLA